MKQNLKDKKEKKHINLQKESAKYNKLSNIKSVMNTSKQTSTKILLNKQSSVKRTKLQRNIDNTIESQTSSTKNKFQYSSFHDSNRSFCLDHGSRIYTSTKDISTDKDSIGKLIYSRRNKESIDSEDKEKVKLRGHSVNNRPSGNLYSNSILKNRNAYYIELKNKIDAKSKDKDGGSNSYNSNQTNSNRELIELNEENTVRTIENDNSKDITDKINVITDKERKVLSNTTSKKILKKTFPLKNNSNNNIKVLNSNAISNSGFGGSCNKIQTRSFLRKIEEKVVDKNTGMFICNYLRIFRLQ